MSRLDWCTHVPRSPTNDESKKNNIDSVEVVGSDGGQTVDEVHIAALLQFFNKQQSTMGNSRCGPAAKLYQNYVNYLFERDYDVVKIANHDGVFCNSYPLELLMIVGSKHEEGDDSRNALNAAQLKQLFDTTRFTRVHGRFAVPVIYCNRKNIARSATLSVLGESILNTLHAKSRNFWSSFYTKPDPVQEDSVEDELMSVSDGDSKPSFLSYLTTGGVDIEKQRNYDARLLKHLRIKYICDLMVEAKKKKLGLTVTSSEKCERQTYKDFCICPIPFPGCEFFKIYKQNNHNGKNLYFDWNQSFVNAEFGACNPEGWTGSPFDFSWRQYRSWDIIALTRNYLRLIVEYVADPSPDSGVLVHCISGWDRTPMFVSLLRLSLWADGVAHQGLNSYEILFLTIAYDWMLFGHQLNNRLNKGEDVFHFCFHMLQYIVQDEFSILPKLRRGTESDGSVTEAGNAADAEADSTDTVAPSHPPKHTSGLSAAFSQLSVASSTDDATSTPVQSERPSPLNQVRKSCDDSEKPKSAPMPIPIKNAAMRSRSAGNHSPRNDADSVVDPAKNGSWQVISSSFTEKLFGEAKKPVSRTPSTDHSMPPLSRQSRSDSFCVAVHSDSLENLNNSHFEATDSKEPLLKEQVSPRVPTGHLSMEERTQRKVKLLTVQSVFVRLYNTYITHNEALPGANTTDAPGADGTPAAKPCDKKTPPENNAPTVDDSSRHSTCREEDSPSTSTTHSPSTRGSLSAAFMNWIPRVSSS